MKENLYINLVFAQYLVSLAEIFVFVVVFLVLKIRKLLWSL